MTIEYFDTPPPWHSVHGAEWLFQRRAEQRGSDAMDGARLSRFPHLSWINLPIPDVTPVGINVLFARRVAHFLCLNLDGTHDVRSIVNGRETHFRLQPDAMQFGIADDDFHTVVARALSPCRRVCMILPRHHLEDHLAEEGCDHWTPRPLLLHEGDAPLRRCLMNLVSTSANDDINRIDESARRLILRIVELTHGTRPDWHADESVFDTRTLSGCVEYIDAHLGRAPSLGDLALRTGLSPSHFAKKFRASTGLSFFRFVNRRRIQASFAELRCESLPLAKVARDLGFSSQSHFTRVFSTLTGMTPAKYRKQSRPVMA